MSFRFHVAPLSASASIGTGSPWFTHRSLRLTRRILQQIAGEPKKPALAHRGLDSGLLQGQVGAVDDAGPLPVEVNLFL